MVKTENDGLKEEEVAAVKCMLYCQLKTTSSSKSKLSPAFTDNVIAWLFYEGGAPPFPKSPANADGSKPPLPPPNLLGSKPP